MWYNNKAVTRTHSKSGSQMGWAIINGVPGNWKRVKPGSDDGVSNIYFTLCQARANGKKVDVYINGNNIEQITLR